MGLRDEARRDKWRRIRSAASRLFTERGYEGTTIRAIAREAGVSTGTVLVYGSSKEALLHEIWREAAMPVVDRALATAREHDDLVEQLMHVLGAMIDHYASEADLARVIVARLAFLEGDVAAAHAPLLARFAGGLRDLLAEAGVDPLDQAARLVFGAYLVALFATLSPLEEVGPEQARERLRADLSLLLIRAPLRR